MNFEIDFSDSNIKSYTIKDDNVIIFIERWNAEIVEIKFLNFVSLFLTYETRASDIKKVFESQLLEKALVDMFEKIPHKHNLRVFKIIDKDDETVLEIVCENFQIERNSPNCL